jgi:glutathione peroxidase
MSFRMHLIALVGLAMVGINPSHGQAPASIHQVKMTDIDGRPVDLSRYKGKVVLLVNVASECGYTPQYKGLQDLHNKYGKDGLVILGVPCNDFGAQEPGTEAQIKEFAQKKFGVEFELFSKVRIAGKEACPLYQLLTAQKTNPTCPGEVRWNFEKFLIGRDGRVVARFGSDTEPDSQDLTDRVRQELAKK